MYQAMIYKKIREVQVVFWVCFCLSLLAVFSSVVYDQISPTRYSFLFVNYSPGLVYGYVFQTDFARVALLAAILIGLNQAIPEEIRKTWPLSIQLMKSRRRVFMTKILVGALSLIVSVGGPLALLMFVTSCFDVLSYPVANVFSYQAWIALLGLFGPFSVLGVALVQRRRRQVVVQKPVEDGSEFLFPSGSVNPSFN